MTDVSDVARPEHRVADGPDALPRVVTAVRLADRTGGGMAQVGLALHRGLLAHGVPARLVSATAPDPPVPDAVRGARDALRGLPGDPARCVVHVHGIWTGFEWRLGRTALRRGLKLVISPHGALEPWPMDHKRLKKRVAWTLYQRALMERAHLIVVNSERERRSLARLRLSPPVAVIPNGVDMTDCPATIAREGETERQRIVLFLARLAPVKGLADLIEAWRGLPDRRGHVLHIRGFGDEGYRRFLERRIAEAGVTDTVRLLPPAHGADKWRALAEASVYVLPSYSENFGIGVAEALWAGLPVVTTEATPWGALAEHRIGWIVPNEPGRIGDALVAAMAMPAAERQALAQRARSFAARHFDWARIVERYLATYGWLLDTTGRTPDWIDSGSS